MLLLTSQFLYLRESLKKRTTGDAFRIQLEP